MTPLNYFYILNIPLASQSMTEHIVLHERLVKALIRVVSCIQLTKYVLKSQPSYQLRRKYGALLHCS